MMGDAIKNAMQCVMRENLFFSHFRNRIANFRKRPTAGFL
jgi:hypothetical protein